MHNTAASFFFRSWPARCLPRASAYAGAVDGIPRAPDVLPACPAPSGGTLGRLLFIVATCVGVPCARGNNLEEDRTSSASTQNYGERVLGARLVVTNTRGCPWPLAESLGSGDEKRLI